MFKLLVFIDKVGNFLTGGKEWETISSRMGKCLVSSNCKSPGKAISKTLCSWLDKIDKNHCIDSIEREMNLRGNIMMKSLNLKPRWGV